MCMFVCLSVGWVSLLAGSAHRLESVWGSTVPLVARCGMVLATLVTNNLLSVILLFISTGGKGEVCEWHLYLQSLLVASCPLLAFKPLFPGVQMHVLHQAANTSNRSLRGAQSSCRKGNGLVQNCCMLCSRSMCTAYTCTVVAKVTCRLGTWCGWVRV